MNAKQEVVLKLLVKSATLNLTSNKFQEIINNSCISHGDILIEVYNVSYFRSTANLFIIFAESFKIIIANACKYRNTLSNSCRSRL